MRWCSVYVMLENTHMAEGYGLWLLHIRIDSQGAEESTSVFDACGICRRTE